MKVTDYIVGALRDQGADHLFVHLGGLNDAFMPPFTETEGVRTVVAAFEGGAAYMADGFARASGGLGACFGIGGPGILNMTTALAASRADRIPVIAISGEVARSWEGMGGFQDASGAALDDVGILERTTGLSISMESPGVVPHHLRHAITLACVEGTPVHLSVPVDVQKAEADQEWSPIPESLLSPRLMDESALDRLIEALNDPESPHVALLVGPGVTYSGGERNLRELAERFQIPVATTLSGRGAFPESHPQSLGVFGYGGSRWAIDAIRSDEIDVLVVIGSGLSQRDTMQWDPRMLPGKAMFHIDAHPALIGRTWPSEIPVVANPAAALERLAKLERSDGLERGRSDRSAFLQRIKDRGPRVYNEHDTESDARPMHPARVVTELRAAYPGEGVLSVDSGAHRAWFAEYWSVDKPGSYLSLPNLGPMGGAIPLGIGAKLARPDRPMMVATGDGCMLMHGMELHTAAKEGIPMVVALMNNGSYGNIYYRAKQMGPAPERLTEIEGIDWVEFARSMGGDGRRVEDPAELGDALSVALAADGPYLLDLSIDKAYPTPVGPWRERQREWEDND